jgi:hypothetical protein
MFKLFGTVIVETKEAIESLEETKDAAKETGESVGELGSESKKAGKTTVDSMNPIPPKFSKVANAGAAVVTAVVAIGTAMIEVAESTREYRLEMGKLETAFTTAGHSTEEATATYQEFYSILGETDRAVEVSQHIAKLCDNEEQMKAMTEACIGAFAMFDDSLPIEGLVEASNETAKTGQLTGVLADALNWAGSSEEDFQQKLNACNTESERTALIIAELTSLYSKAGAAYKKNNKDVIEATKAQEKLNAATARWGELCEPAATAWTNFKASVVNFFADEVEEMTHANVAFDATVETAEEAAAKVESLRIQLRKLEQTSPHLWTEQHENQKKQLTEALEEAEAQYTALVEAERLAAEEATSAANASSEAASKFSAITEQYVADAMALFETFGQTYENTYNKVSGFFAPFEKASISVKTSVKEMMEAMQSQIEFNNTYSANLQKLKEYGLGSLSDAFQSYGANGAAYAATIVEAVEKAGGATTEKGQEIIQGFYNINQEVVDSREDLSYTMSLMNGEFEQQLNDMVGSLGNTVEDLSDTMGELNEDFKKKLQDMVEIFGVSIEDLDKSEEASASAKATFEAFLNGMNKKLPEIKSQMKSFGQQITSSLQSGIGSVTIPVTIKTEGSIPGAKSGMDYVPYDNYLVYLHKGEAVLTAEEATAWRAGKEVASKGINSDSGSGGGVTVNQYIESVPQTPVELASTTAAYFEQARWIT